MLSQIDWVIGDRKVLLLTSPGFIKRGLVDKIKELTDKIVVIIDDILPNPTFSDLNRNFVAANSQEIDLIVALGGGSVVDSAKVLSLAYQGKSFDWVESIIKNGITTGEYHLTPLIAIPTTAGTGSEVTPWATVWDMEEKKKYSLHLENLWCEQCICDPELTLSLPRELTLQTALDALSHSLEAIWNKNANPFSTRYAITAAKEIITILPQLMNNLDDLILRERMMYASLMAGLAFSNTQTAIAHAISYYLTANYGIPHGIACSFLLPDIIDLVIEDFPELSSYFKEMFGNASSDNLRVLYKDLGISTEFRDYHVYDDDLKQLKASLDSNSRAGNSIVNIERLFL
jgi:hypothetical protein